MMYDAVSSHQSKMLSMKVFIEHIKRNSGSVTQVFEENGEEGDSDWSVNLENLPTIRQATDSLIREALRRSEGNQSVAAKILGITPQALSARIKRIQTWSTFNRDINIFSIDFASEFDKLFHFSRSYLFNPDIIKIVDSARPVGVYSYFHLFGFWHFRCRIESD